MSGFSQFLGAIAGQVASRVILNKVANVGLSQSREPAREPGPVSIPNVIIPKGAEFDRVEAGAPSRSYKIPTWLFFTGYGALLWYAAKATAPVDMPDLGDPGPEAEPLLFPGLKRELTHLDVEDISTSDDPVEACLERDGWKLDRIDELRQSIFEKEQVDLFTTPEPLTRSEGELLEAIETCMQKLEIQYGSLEAAGVACSTCGDPDLGVVQREMFDPEQIELEFDPKRKKIKRNYAIEAEVRQNDRLPLDSEFRSKLYKAYQKFIGTKDEERFLESVIKNISGNPRVEKTQDGYTNGLWTVTRSGLRKGDIFEKWEDIPKDIVEYLASHPELVEYWEKQLE